MFPLFASGCFISVERVDGAQARLKLAQLRLLAKMYSVERVDGAQARLKHLAFCSVCSNMPRGKGGWGSGEIETTELVF